MAETANRNADGSKKRCSADEGCDRDAYVTGLCNTHYQRMRSHGDSTLDHIYDICPTPSCGRRKSRQGVICKRCNQFRWRFSLTPEEVIRLHAPENRRCQNPGCGSPDRLHMDHDHSCCPPSKFPQSHKVSCGKCVRGWLCRPCNTSLGQLRENPQIIRGLLDFLESFKTQDSTA